MTEDLAMLERELLRSILRDDFASFVRWGWPLVTGMELVTNDAIAAVVRALQDVADGKIARLLIAMPPGVGKSTLLCLYSAWRLARRADWRSIHASHSFEIAATESRRVRRLVEGDAFRRMFPHVVMRGDENTIGAWRTTKDGAYYAAGRDTALTGRRAHEAICDDPLNAIDRFSRAAREALWVWFQEALSTRLDGDRAPVVVVQQRLDRDDLIGRLIEQGGWTLVELPAIREDGTLLAPNVLSREKLDALRAQIGELAFVTQYLQRPSDDSQAVIKRAWWSFHHAKHVSPIAPRPAGCDVERPAVPTPDSFDAIVIAADLTFGSLTGDYAVAQVWASYGGARYLLEQWRARAGFDASLAAIVGLAERYPRAAVVVEKAANGAAVIEKLRERIATVIAMKPLGAKQARIAAMAPTVESGACLLPLGAPWLGEFVEELAGATKHDDMADTAAYALAQLARRAAVSSAADGIPMGGDIDDVIMAAHDSDGAPYSYGGAIDVPRNDFNFDFTIDPRFRS